MMTIEVAMPSKVKARPAFSSVIARAGITRLELALQAGVSVRTIDSLANPNAAGRSGRTREITAWRIARGLAALAGRTDDAVYAELFEPVDTITPNPS
jgi:hypothetical protein